MRIPISLSGALIAVAMVGTVSTVATAPLGAQTSPPAAATAPAAQAQTPDQIVEAIARELGAALHGHRKEYMKDKPKLVELANHVLESHFDESYSVILVLGDYARTATPEQIFAFQKAFYNALLDRYAAELTHYRESRVTVIPARAPLEGPRAIARTHVKLNDGKEVSVDFVFRKDPDGQWKAYDVVIEGISYIASYRSQVGDEIRHIGLDGLIKRLQTEGLSAFDKPKKTGAAK